VGKEKSLFAVAKKPFGKRFAKNCLRQALGKTPLAKAVEKGLQIYLNALL